MPQETTTAEEAIPIAIGMAIFIERAPPDKQRHALYVKLAFNHR